MPITIYENNAPSLTFRLKEKLPTGETLPFKLDGAPVIEFVIKNALDDLDANAVAKYSTATGEVTISDDGTGVTDLFSVAKVQMLAAHTALPKTYFYRLDVIKGGNRQTVDNGVLEIKNV